jgi:hypothetical protein
MVTMNPATLHISDSMRVKFEYFINLNKNQLQ